MKKGKILSAILIALVAAVLGGCSGKSSAKDDRALSYLKKKYGMQFVIDGYYNSNDGKEVERSKIITHPTNNKSKPFIVERVKIGTDTKITYEDDYSCRLIEPMIDEKVKNILGDDSSNIKCASYVSAEDYQNLDDYTSKIDYDAFIKDQGNNATINIIAVVNHGDNFDKNTEAQKVYSFMKKIVDNKLVKTHMHIEVSFYFVKSQYYNKTSPQAIAYRYNRSMMDSEWLNKNEDTTKNYVDHSFTLRSQDGLSYNQDINEIMKNMH
ncbi:hypothetical protein NL50_03535 [Clostridium acetobutylicum]|nr:hypothetical protein NL50_03535 [Clostridium acetobutylicum]